MIKAGERVKIRPIATADWHPIIGEVIEDDELALRVHGNGHYDHVVPWSQIARIEVTREAA